MTVAITGQDVLDAIGIPAASPTDAGWADDCAAAASAYVNEARPEPDTPSPDTLLAAVMLGANLYRRRPAGSGAPDGDPSAAAAVDGTIGRLLRIGYYSPPVVA